MRSIQVINWTIYFYHLIVLLLSLTGGISFGHGLGDLGMALVFFCSFLLLIALNTWAFRSKEKTKKLASYIALGIGVLSFLTLTASFTIWRGPEYGWNGEVFYPSAAQKRERFIQDSVKSERLKMLSNNIKSDPNNFENYVGRARESYQNQDYKSAITDYEQALKINDTSLVANLEIGLAYWHINDYENALRYNEKALKQDTSYFLAKHRVRLLREEIKKQSR